MSDPVYVADAGAIIAYVRKEPGWEVLPEAIGRPDGVVYAHAANLAEVFYDFRRSDGEEMALSILDDLATAGVLFREDFDRALWLDAARIKADYRRVSLADCFGLAFARRVGGAFLTTDHHELEPIDEAGVCKVEFIR